MTTPHIRAATVDDLDAIRRVHTASWQSAYVGMLPASYLERVPARHETQWAQLPAAASTTVAEVDGRVIGFACVQPGEAPLGDHLLDNLHVDPTERGSGVGSALLRHVLQVATAATPGGSVYLWVFEANAGGRRFYEREGGHEAGTRVELLAPGVEVVERQVCWALTA